MDFKGKVSTDTRTIEEGDVFFALKGERFDGHEFIGEALQKGAKVIVYSDEKYAEKFRSPSIEWIHAEDTLRAYGDWAASARRKSNVRVVAVTGSSGKTTVKEMLAHVLGAHFSVHKNQGTENNLVGVPKTIFGLSTRHEILILELGTNLPGEIARLSEIAQPDIAVITRVGASHLEGLGSIEGVRTEKLSIVQGLKPGGPLWINGDDANLESANPADVRVCAVGIESSRAQLRAKAIEPIEEGMAFRVDGSLFELSCLGRHNILNALLVIGVCREFGMSDADIRKALISFQPVSGRLQIRRVEGFIFLDDTYNANPVSFEAAVGVLSGFPARGRRIVVAGDMLELGDQSEILHRELGRRIAAHRVDFILTVGEKSKLVAEEALKAGLNSHSVRMCQNSTEAGEILRTLLKSGDVVLVKGSRGMKMEKIFECFTPSFTR